MRNRFKEILATLSVIVITVVISSGCSRSSADTSAENQTPETVDTAKAVIDNHVQVAGQEEGQIVFFSGMVDLRRSGENSWTPADIGQEVLPGDTIRTLDDSWCEIQFGNLAVVKVDKKSIFTVESITDQDSGNRNLSGTLASGTVVSKIRKLTGKESLSVSTPTVICSVRGTVFMVSTETDNTTIAVEEGSVAIAPKALAGGAGEAEIDAGIAETLDAAFPVLEAGSQVTLGAREMDVIESEVAAVLEILESGSPDISTVETSADRISAALGGETVLSEESREVMESMERMEVGEEAAEEGETLVKVSWIVSPPDAEIRMKGASGTGSLSGTWKEGETIILEASRTGYEDFREEYTAGDSPDENHINLKRLPTKYFDLSVNLQQATIMVDGTEENGSIYRGAIPWGESREVVVSLDGHNAHHYLFSHEDAPEGQMDVILEPTIARTVSAVSGSVVGLDAGDGILYLSDHEGTLYALDDDGERIWRRVTTNSPNDAGRPHIIRDKIFFSGINEFIVVEGDSGRVAGQNNQNTRSMHLMGRRSIPFENAAIYPATDELRIIDPDDGSIVSSFPVPGESRMTPVIHGGLIWTVSTDGTVYGFSRKGSQEARISTGADKPISHAPALAEGIIWFGDRSGTVYAVNLDSRSLEWKTSIGGSEPTPVSEDVSVDRGIVLVYSKGTAYLLDATTGRAVTDAVTGFSAPPILLDGFIYGGTESGELTAYKASTGEEISRVPINGLVKSNAAVYGRQLVFGTDQGEVFYVNPQHPSHLEVSGE